MITEPPSNLEIEQQVLGAAFVSDNAADKIINTCKPADFYYLKHQKIYSEMVQIRQKKMCIEFTTLASQLDKDVLLDVVELGNMVITDDLLDQHLQILKEFSHKRILLSIRDSIEIEDYRSILNEIQQEQNSLKSSIVDPEVINEAIIKYYRTGSDKGLSTGWTSLDYYFTIGRGQLTIVTGIPGSGKSEWLDAVCINLANECNLKTMYFSPENMPIQRHVRKLLEKYSGKPFFSSYQERMLNKDLDKSLQWIHQHFKFLSPDIDNRSVEYLLSQIRDVDMFVLDPWNEMEHKRPQNITETEYISQSLMKIKAFAVANNIHFWIIAHPTKLQKNKKGDYPVPKPYDISGSANWRNKADNCIALHRIGNQHQIQIHVQKIRLKDNGKIGMIELYYDPRNGRFSSEKLL